MTTLKERLQAAELRVAEALAEDDDSAITESALDEDLGRNLQAYIENDQQLYRQQREPIIKNLLRKIVKDKYNHQQAPKLWGYLVDNGAKKFAKEQRMPGNWHAHFPKALRTWVAKQMADEFVDEYNTGGYNPEDYGVKGEGPKKLKK